MSTHSHSRIRRLYGYYLCHLPLNWAHSQQGYQGWQGCKVTRHPAGYSGVYLNGGRWGYRGVRFGYGPESKVQSPESWVVSPESSARTWVRSKGVAQIHESETNPFTHNSLISVFRFERRARVFCVCCFASLLNWGKTLFPFGYPCSPPPHGSAGCQDSGGMCPVSLCPVRTWAFKVRPLTVESIFQRPFENLQSCRSSYAWITVELMELPPYKGYFEIVHHGLGYLLRRVPS